MEDFSVHNPKLSTIEAVADAMKLTNKAVAEALDGLPAYKMHCSVLAEEAIQSALQDYEKRTGKTIPKAE